MDSEDLKVSKHNKSPFTVFQATVVLRNIVEFKLLNKAHQWKRIRISYHNRKILLLKETKWWIILSCNNKQDIQDNLTTIKFTWDILKRISLMDKDSNKIEGSIWDWIVNPHKYNSMCINKKSNPRELQKLENVK